MEVVYFVFFCQLIADFQICLEQIFKQFEFLWFPIKCGQCRCEGFGQFRDSVYVVVEVGWITVRRQLLRGQQSRVCFNCRGGVFTAKLWLTCRARLLFFPDEVPGEYWGISSWKSVTMWGYSSTSELFKLPEWWEEHTTSGQASFRERSPVGSRFPESPFLDVPGTATEQVVFVLFALVLLESLLLELEFVWPPPLLLLLLSALFVLFRTWSFSRLSWRH